MTSTRRLKPFDFFNSPRSMKAALGIAILSPRGAHATTQDSRVRADVGGQDAVCCRHESPNSGFLANQLPFGLQKSALTRSRQMSARFRQLVSGEARSAPEAPEFAQPQHAPGVVLSESRTEFEFAEIVRLVPADCRWRQFARFPKSPS